MAKPEVLEIVDVHPGTTAELEEAYTVHKLWLASDVDAFLARVGPGVRGIATNGIAGTKGVPLAALPKLEIVGVFGVGVDAVDLETARSKGVRVTNTPGRADRGRRRAGHGSAAGRGALRHAATTATCARAAGRRRAIRRWPASLTGRRLGILGLGRIGRRVAEMASVFGMQIAYCGRSRKADVDYAYYDDPAKLAAAVDCLVVSCVGGPTHGGPGQPRGDRGAGPEGLADQHRARLGGRRGRPGRRAGRRPARRRRARRVRQGAAGAAKRCWSSTTSCCSRIRAARPRRPAAPWAG